MKMNKSLFLITAVIVIPVVSLFLMSCNKPSKKEKKDQTAKVQVTQKTVPSISTELSDKNASENTKLLMNYFVQEVYGKRIISGIMDCAWSNSIDMDSKVLEDTGYQTALMGFDFIFATKDDSANWYNPTQTEKAISWWLNGGIVAFTWHWLDPSADSGSGASYKPSEISFRIPYDEKNDCLDTSTKEFKYIQKDLDTIAERLDLMQQLGVVVLWRPLHEARGNWGAGWAGANAWFWWGASGPKAYKALYRYMFDYFTNEKELHNLIWVWNGQGKEWYPGDDCVDIVGYDIYDDKNKNNDGLSYYKDLMEWCGNSKMAAISEGSYIPSTEKLEASSANWLYYMIWNDDDNLMDDTSDDNDNFWGGTKFNSIEAKTVNSFNTDFHIKYGDETLMELFSQME